MQTATGNLINDNRFAVEAVPGLEVRRWTGYIDIKSTDSPGKWYAVNMPNTGRDDANREVDRVMVLPHGHAVHHFAIAPFVAALVPAVAQLSLRNPAFVDNERTVSFINASPRLSDLALRYTRNALPNSNTPYLSHQVWVKLIGAPTYNGRLVVSLGAIRTAPVFDFFVPGNQNAGPLVWGERRNGTIGLIPGSEGAGDDGIRPGGRDFPEEAFFSVSPDTADLAPGQSITLYASGPATWTLTGGGTLSATSGNTVTYTAPGGVGNATIVAVSTDDPTATATIPITVTVPTVSALTLTSDVPALLVGGSAFLTANITGTGAFNPAVTFSITGPGTMSGSGSTRTVVAIGPGAIVVTATSVADPTKTASVTLGSTIPVPVVTSIALVSDKYTMTTLQTATLTAGVVVTGAGTTNVTFTSTGPGTLSGTGNSRTLTPTGPGTITVVATSVQDPTKTASVSIGVSVGVAITAVTLAGSPLPATILGTVGLTATVTGSGGFDGTVTLAILNGPGSIVPLGYFSGLTTANLVYGATPTSGATTVRATSVADPSKFADLIIPLGVDSLITSVVVTPSVAAINPLGSFTATAAVNPSSRPQAVTWTVAGPATLVVAAGVPTVTATGPGVITITATSVANPSVFGSATVNSTIATTVTSVLAFRATSGGALVTSPPPVPGGTSTYASATVYGTGTFSPLVVWTIVNGGGSIVLGSPNIVEYTAPATTTVGQFATLRATSVADPTKFADLVIAFDTTVAVTQVSWIPTGPIASTWYPGESADPSLSPPVANLSSEVLFEGISILGTGAFNPNVTITAPAGVVVSPAGAWNSSTAGKIFFPLTNPAAPTTYTIRATSVGDPTKFADLVVTRTRALRDIPFGLNYRDPFFNSYPQNASDPVPPIQDVGGAFYASVSTSNPPFGSPALVTWTVTGPGTFTTGPYGGTPNTFLPNADITIVATGAGTITATATSVYDPTKSASLTFTVVAPAVVVGVQVSRVDGQPLNTPVYRSVVGGDEYITYYTAVAVGSNLSGPLSTNRTGVLPLTTNPFNGSAGWFLADPSAANPPLEPPGIARDGNYTTGYLQYFTSGFTEVLRFYSVQDPSKFTDVAVDVVLPPPNFVVGISITDANQGVLAPADYEPGVAAQRIGIRNNYKLQTSVSGPGAIPAQGSVLTVVSGGSVAALTAVGPATVFNLTRIANSSGWVVVRATSIGDPSKYREEAFYFAPKVFTIMALKHPAGSSVAQANVLRLYWPGLSEPLTFTSTNVSVLSAEMEPVTSYPEPDSQGRAVAINFQFNPGIPASGPFSITASLSSNPSASQTVSFTKDASGFIVGDLPTIDGTNGLLNVPVLTLFSSLPPSQYTPTYTVRPSRPAKPPTTSTI